VDCLTAALAYAARGWSVFPLAGKRPYPGTHGYLDATTNEKTIRAWWRQWPEANVAIACSSVNGPIVIDIDGPSGEPLVEELGLPPTREATSGRLGRRHLYYAASDATIKRTIRPRGKDVAFDVLGDGGYVVAPPSVHPETGKPYRWTRIATPRPVPGSVAALVTKRSGPARKNTAAPMPDEIGEGSRDDMLTSLAGSMRRRGMAESSILAALLSENEKRCNPPLSQRQVEKIARSIGKKEPVLEAEHFSDMGNARRFVQQHRKNVKSIPSLRWPWLIWDGKRWVADNARNVHNFAKEVVRQLYVDASSLADETERAAALKFALRSEAAYSLRAILEAAATEPDIRTSEGDLDANPWLLNVENGTLNLRTSELQPHKRSDLITKLAPVVYTPGARATRWEVFLHEIMDGDDELVEFLQRAAGYFLTGDTREQCLFFFYGHGANGKSTFIEVFRALMGDYAQSSAFTTLQKRSGDGPRTDVARMRGARMVTAVEADDKGFDEMVVKQLTGGDTIVARQLYEREFEFKPQHKLVIAANHQPAVKDTGESFWRRIRIVPFNVTIPAAKRDKRLVEKLIKRELPGILNWALEGCRRWQADGLIVPDAVRHATEEYRDDTNTFGDFIAQRCVIKKGSGWTSVLQLYRAYSEWWQSTTGTQCFTTPIAFSKMLAQRPDIQRSKRHDVRGYRGISLKQENTK
jgi:putative DNA primase/helicase